MTGESWLNFRRRFALMLCLPALGCRPTPRAAEPVPQVVEPAPEPEPRSASVELDCRVVERPAPTGAFASEITERASFLNPSNLMLLQQQPTHPSRYAASRRGGGFPGAPFAEVRAFAMHFADDGQVLLDSAMSGCEHESLANNGKALSTDGRLCPAVDKRFALLTPEQVTRLRQLTGEPPPPKLRHCRYDPRLTFVFYDEAGAPVADVSVYFHCSKWSLSGQSPVNFSAKVRTELSTLCHELGLPGCPRQRSDEEEDAFESAYSQWYRSGAPARPSQVFGIAKTRTLASLTPEERLALCAWRAIELKDWHFRRVDSDYGPSSMLQSLETCVATFPECALTLGEVEQTDFRRVGWPEMKLPSTPACRAHWLSQPLRGCLWGLNPKILDLEYPTPLPPWREPQPDDP